MGTHPGSPYPDWCRDKEGGALLAGIASPLISVRPLCGASTRSLRALFILNLSSVPEMSVRGILPPSAVERVISRMLTIFTQIEVATESRQF